MPMGSQRLEQTSSAVGAPPGVLGLAGGERSDSPGTKRKTLAYGATADGAGDAELRLPAVESGAYWLVERISVRADNTPAGNAVMLDIYAGEPGRDRDWTDGTTLGALAVAEYPSYLLIPAGARLSMRWSNLDADDNVVARVQYIESREAA